MTVSSQQVIRIDGSLIGEMFWTAISAIVSIIIGALFWKFGADFTILALKWLARAFGGAGDGGFWYVIPFTFSLAELASWKLRASLTSRMRSLFVGMTGLDMGSTIFGVGIAIIVGPTSYFALLGLANPLTWMYAAAAVIALLAGYLVTIYPERLILDGLIQLWELGKFIFIVVTKKVR